MPKEKRPFDRRAFWDQKIISWEERRYGVLSTQSTSSGLGRKVAARSLISRQRMALEILQPHIIGKHILELGCGSGLLAADLIEAGAASYLGIDLSARAIENSRRLAAERELSGSVRFEVGNVSEFPQSDADIVFSLGLFDWLSDGELDRLHAQTRGMDFLHSISEKKASPAQWVHRIYCYLTYGYRTDGYVPSYMHAAPLAEKFRQGVAGREIRVIRHADMRFGAFLTTLPAANAERVEGD